MANSLLETQALHGVVIMSKRVPRNGVGEIAGTKGGDVKRIGVPQITEGIEAYVIANRWLAARAKHRLLCRCAREADERPV